MFRLNTLQMFEADNQQYAVAYIVFSSVGGSVLGPIVGGFVEQHLAWRWNIWIQLIFGGAVQIAHFFLVPETRSTIMMDRIAKKRRKSGQNPNIYGPNELEPFKERFSAKETLVIWMRPFRMFVTEPIVLVLSLLSGFSDALIFMFIQSFALVYELWEFNASEIGLSFIAIGLGYTLAWILFIPAIKRNIKQRAQHPDDERVQYEGRLWWLLWTAPCLPIGLISEYILDLCFTAGGLPVQSLCALRQFMCLPLEASRCIHYANLSSSCLWSWWPPGPIIRCTWSFDVSHSGGHPVQFSYGQLLTI